MSIQVYCRDCGKSYKVGDEHAGKRAKCKQGHAIFIPRPTLRAIGAGAGAQSARRAMLSPAMMLLLAGVSMAAILLAAITVTACLVFLRY